jgi:hypothetical protein
MVALSNSHLLLYGGALCIPGCTCHGDTWTFDIGTGQWTEHNATGDPDVPIHRYRQSLVLNAPEGALYLFGGESYKPYMYHNAVNRLQLPSALTAEVRAAAPSGDAAAAAALGASAPTSSVAAGRGGGRHGGRGAMRGESWHGQQHDLLEAGAGGGGELAAGGGGLSLVGVGGPLLAILLCVVCFVQHKRRQQEPLRLYRPVGR